MASDALPGHVHMTIKNVPLDARDRMKKLAMADKLEMGQFIAEASKVLENIRAGGDVNGAKFVNAVTLKGEQTGQPGLSAPSKLPAETMIALLDKAGAILSAPGATKNLTKTASLMLDNMLRSEMGLPPRALRKPPANRRLALSGPRQTDDN